MANESKYCECCWAKMVEYNFRFNKGLGSCLLKLHRARVPVYVGDLGLTNSEYSNFPKLQYWDLIKRVDQQEKGARWVLTDKGVEFVERGGQIHQRVVTYRGKVVKYEGELITLEKAHGRYDWRPYYMRSAVPVGNVRQEALFS